MTSRIDPEGTQHGHVSDKVYNSAIADELDNIIRLIIDGQKIDLDSIANAIETEVGRQIKYGQ